MNIRTLSDWASAPAFALTIFAACSASPEQKHAEAVTSYSAQFAGCVAEAKAHMKDDSEASKAAARVESDACAARVKAAWAVDGGAR